jgi:hypothetical protein
MRSVLVFSFSSFQYQVSSDLRVEGWARGGHSEWPQHHGTRKDPKKFREVGWRARQATIRAFFYPDPVRKAKEPPDAR